MRKINYIIIHHSLTKDGVKKDIDAIRRYHMKTKGWSDIGYHYIIEKDGGEVTNYGGRFESVIGSHVKGMNRNTLGICVVGNFDKEYVSEDVWEVTRILVEDLCVEYDLEPSHVLGHWEAQQLQGIPRSKRKSCPGKNFDMKKFRRDLNI